MMSYKITDKKYFTIKKLTITLFLLSFNVFFTVESNNYYNNFDNYINNMKEEIFNNFENEEDNNKILLEVLKKSNELRELNNKDFDEIIDIFNENNILKKQIDLDKLNLELKELKEAFSEVNIFLLKNVENSLINSKIIVNIFFQLYTFYIKTKKNLFKIKTLFYQSIITQEYSTSIELTEGEKKVIPSKIKKGKISKNNQKSIFNKQQDIIYEGLCEILKKTFPTVCSSQEEETILLKEAIENMLYSLSKDIEKFLQEKTVISKESDINTKKLIKESIEKINITNKKFFLDLPDVVEEQIIELGWIKCNYILQFEELEKKLEKKKEEGELKKEEELISFISFQKKYFNILKNNDFFFKKNNFDYNYYQEKFNLEFLTYLFPICSYLIEGEELYSEKNKEYYKILNVQLESLDSFFTEFIGYVIYEKTMNLFYQKFLPILFKKKEMDCMNKEIVDKQEEILFLIQALILKIPEEILNESSYNQVVKFNKNIEEFVVAKKKNIIEKIKIYIFNSKTNIHENFLISIFNIIQSNMTDINFQKEYINKQTYKLIENIKEIYEKINQSSNNSEINILKRKEEYRKEIEKIIKGKIDKYYKKMPQIILKLDNKKQTQTINLKEKNSKIREQQNQLKEKDKIITEQKQQQKEMEQEFKEQLQKKDIELNKKTNQLKEQKNQQIENNNKKTIKLNEDIEKLKKQIEKLEQEKNNIQEKLNNKNKNLNQELEDQKKIIEVQKTNFEDQLKRIIAEKTNCFEKLQEEKNYEIGIVQQQLQEQIKNVEKKLQEVTQINKKIEEEKQQLKEENEKSKENNKQIKQQNEQLVRQLNQLKSDKNNKDSEVQEENLKLKQEVQELKQQLQEKKQGELIQNRNHENENNNYQEINEAEGIFNPQDLRKEEEELKQDKQEEEKVGEIQQKKKKNQQQNYYPNNNNQLNNFGQYGNQYSSFRQDASNNPFDKFGGDSNNQRKNNNNQSNNFGQYGNQYGSFSQNPSNNAFNKFESYANNQRKNNNNQSNNFGQYGNQYSSFSQNPSNNAFNKFESYANNQGKNNSSQFSNAKQQSSNSFYQIKKKNNK